MAYDKTKVTEEELKKIQTQQREFTQLKYAYGKNAVAHEEAMANYRISQAKATELVNELDEKYKDKDDRKELLTDEEKENVAAINSFKEDCLLKLGDVKMQEFGLDKIYSKLKMEVASNEKRIAKKYGYDSIIDIGTGVIKRANDALPINEEPTSKKELIV